MKEVNTQAEKGICICRKDTSIAVSLQDKKYLDDYALTNKKGSVKEALAEILAAHRKGAAA